MNAMQLIVFNLNVNAFSRVQLVYCANLKVINIKITKITGVMKLLD